MSTATVAAKETEEQGESKREEKGKTKGEEDQMSTATVAAKGTEGADIILIIYIMGRRVIFENKYLLTLAHLYIVINYANHSEGATLLLVFASHTHPVSHNLLGLSNYK